MSVSGLYTICQSWVHCCCSNVLRQVSLPSYQDVFVCRTCLGHNCSVEEKLEFKRSEEKVKKFCYLGDMISYGGAPHAVSETTGSAWKKFQWCG